MSQYNSAPLCAADNAGWDAIIPELTPLNPMTDHLGPLNPSDQAATGQPIGSEAALPPDDESVPLHARAGSTGCVILHPLTEALACAALACSASFATNQQLEQHAAKSKHKAYLCTCGCQKGFTKRSALLRHIRESAQAREHRCPLPACDHKCKRVGHVEQHLRLVHNKSKDEIKKLLSSRKPEPRQGPAQASISSAAVPVTGSTVSQAANPAIAPGGPGPWSGPGGFAAMAPVGHPGSWPGYFSAFFPGPGAMQMTGAPAFPTQNFMMQDLGLAANPGYPVNAVAAQADFFAYPAPDVSGYPAAPLGGTDNFFNVNPAPVSVNPSDGFGMPVPETDFVEEFYDPQLNTFRF